MPIQVCDSGPGLMISNLLENAALLRWLVADVAGPQAGLDLGPFLDRLAGRTLFFVPQLENLQGRLKNILDAAKEEKAPFPAYTLGRDDLYRGVNGNEGMTLYAAVKIIEAIEKLGTSRNPLHRELVSYQGVPMQFATGCVVPSLLHIEPDDLRELFGGRGAFEWANAMGLTPNAIRLLEAGEEEGERYRHFRVTLRFANTFVERVNVVRGNAGQSPIRLENIFSADPGRGPRKGQNTTALRKANGNMVQGMRSAAGPRPAL